jgi:LysM repeat protein
MKQTRHILFTALFILAATVAFAQTGSFFTHTVKKGDTLYSLSNTYGVTIDEIVKNNPGSDKKLIEGQKLRIPQKSQNGDSENNGGKGMQYHTVQQGETLYRLGKKYGITVQAICDANPGLSFNNFKAGEVILIPTGQKANENIQEPKPEKKVVKRDKKVYTVKKGDSVYKICNKFNISEEQLIKANPELKSKKLKEDMALVIPESTKEITVAAKEQSNQESFILYEQYKDSIKQSIANEEENEGLTKVGIVLSFLLDSYAPKEQNRIIEYYQGFLLAVNRLKQEGYSFEINAYDAGKKDESIDSLLSSGMLDDMDLIIGATYTKHNKQLADFAKKKKIPLVIPFTSKDKNLYQNPMVYMVNSNQSYIIPDVALQFVKTFPKANVVFVEDTIAGDKKEFIEELTEVLDKKKIPHTTISMANLTNPRDAITTLRSLKVAGKDNIIVPTNSSSKTLKTLLPLLIHTKHIDSTDVSQYKLFGYPEWQIHAKETKGQMYEIDTYFYAPFFSHHTLPQVSEFNNEFSQWYDKEILDIYPRYGLLGYDTGYYFLLAAALHGDDMAERINSIDYQPLQRGFKFDRVNNWGGMVNKKFYFIHFTPEFHILRIDYDK